MGVCGVYNGLVSGKVIGRFFLMLLLAGPALRVGRAGGIAPLRGVWEVLPRRFAGTFVGRGGRCFYLLAGPPAKRPSVSAAGAVAPGFEPVLLDRTGRLWLLAPDGVALHGVQGESVRTLAPPRGAFFRTTGRAGGVVVESAAAYEDAAGRAWFGTSRGVQWLNGTRWQAKDLAEANGLDVGRPMGTIRFAEDARGRVFLWATSGKDTCGTAGFWVFDGRAWTHHTTRSGLLSDRVRAVCPVGDDAVLVNTAAGRLFRFGLDGRGLGVKVARLVGRLNDERWGVRRDATAALAKLGPGIAFRLEGYLGKTLPPEVRSRIQMVLVALKGRPGRRWVLANSSYVCAAIEVEPSLARRRPPRTAWLAEASDVVDTASGKALGRVVLLISAASVRPVHRWPVSDRDRRVWTLGDGRGGLWIGQRGLGVFHWDGRQVREVSEAGRRGYGRIFGRDAAGRILVGDGRGVAAYVPGRSGSAKVPGDGQMR